jgi:alpha-1,3-rhamnosyl/mannosyltransferase
MPFFRSAPGVVLVHDLQPWAFPENFSGAKRAYLRATVPPSIRKARAVTTLSRWVQRDVQQRVGAPLSHMLCIPPGCERLVGVTDRPTSDDEVLRRFDLVDRPFFLYPVITYPHKNHLLLLRAFEQVAATHPHVELVLTGGEGSSEQTVLDAIARSPVRARLRRLGRVTNAELAAFYRTTTALTFPSRYEGFGMPVLEVMGEGRPVLVADSTALPEVVGDGGLLLDPDDDRAWATAMARVLDEPQHWRALAAAATTRAATFSWDKSIDALLTLYRNRGRVTSEDPASS